MPVIDSLGIVSSAIGDDVRELYEALAARRYGLKWEQSYTRDDEWITEAMLEGYAWTDVIGVHGPFVSEGVRAAFGVWGPRIVYPAHYHAFEELYIVLAGNGVFRLDGEPVRHAASGDVVHIPSRKVHGFSTADEPLVLLGLCQNGDLREKSRPAT
jgi:quercetin dioxygenase-like cupin family protein